MLLPDNFIHGTLVLYSLHFFDIVKVVCYDLAVVLHLLL